jgi:putative oxidoreductase
MTSIRTPDFSLWQNFAILLARILIGWIYVESGFRKLIDMGPFIASLVRRGVPQATVWGWIGAPLEFLGGLALLLGAFTRCAALAILVFTIVATAIGHRYWEIAEPAARRMQASHFFKNLAMMGGILLLVVTGGGKFSVDGWRRR